MKKVFFLSALFLFSLVVYSQQAPPTYIEIIKRFCKNYEPLEDYTNYTKFAKKKDGWYVIQVNQMLGDTLLAETLFYSFAKNNYIDISSDYKKTPAIDINRQLEKYINFGGSTADWYAFEHIAYYGYNGWYTDMIKDFGYLQNLSDTMHDGLGRAYVNLANSYLWYQSGGLNSGEDTLQRKLERLEYPSAQRINKVKEAIDKSIIQFEQLSKSNPTYENVVGNSVLKTFNEYLHGYNQMTMCGNDIIAKQYINKATLPEPYIQQAKNYLNSCDAGAILFSYGDNDTYQLWYVQEKYNFRKDVIVINNSLLGLPIYVHMFKRKHIVPITIPELFLKSASNDIIYFQEDKATSESNKIIPINNFLKNIYTKKFSSVFYYGNKYITYPYLKASINIPVALNSALKNIIFPLSKNYYFINDIAMFDIISNNITKRPIYFTSSNGNPFEKYLIQKGIVYKLMSEDASTPEQITLQAKGLEKFIVEKHIPVLSNGKDITSFDGDNTFFAMYFNIFNYYLEKGDSTSFRKWVNLLQKTCPEIYAPQISVAKNLSFYFIEAGDVKKGIHIANQYALWLSDAYYKPTSLKGYYFKETYRDELIKSQTYLTSKKIESQIINNLIKN